MAEQFQIKTWEMVSSLALACSNGVNFLLDKHDKRCFRIVDCLNSILVTFCPSAAWNAKAIATVVWVAVDEEAA